MPFRDSSVCTRVCESVPLERLSGVISHHPVQFALTINKKTSSET